MRTGSLRLAKREELSMDQVGSLLNRPKAYNNIDGTGELAMGFMSLGYALIIWLQVHTPKDSIWNQMYVLFIWVGLMIAIISYGTKAIKNHITYPRTGFVAYRRHNIIWLAIIAFVISALASAGLSLAARSHRDTVVPVFFFGLLLAACYAFGIAKAVRWKWAVVLALVIGSLAIAVLPGDLTATLSGGASMPAWLARSAGAFLLFLMLYGAMLLISGGISLWLYLRHTQAPAKEGQ
jgi:hypothetical protein